ncbi:MAG: Glutathione S-transferase [uncultured Sphingomonadaceae bacterium]|uniref:Glutathione S-transferase n=1 Tax=uncultured Sphingomonadaceae bacterium TaxID=169976 RepID=A0A6J4SG60_9SPHN|nr:MAG: Glutathione S-transferase [uncultured Sphingomonadaceae bacterium]
MPQLTLYHNPMSRGQIARWMLEEVGEPYELALLDYGTTMKESEFLALNPMGKVPALRHGDRVVTEAAAICAYLADAFPDAGLAPAPADRHDYYRWLFFAAGPAEAAITAKAMGLLAPADKAAIAGYGSYDQAVDALERAVDSREFVAGDRFSAADVYVGSQVIWGTMFGTLPHRPAFDAYAATLRARPAYLRQRELDAALMPKQTA